MRVDSAAFALANQSDAKSLRTVVKIEFSAASLYLTSHAGISGIPATEIAGCVQEPSISSQKLNPDQGRSEIGSASFEIVDLNRAFTDYVRTKLEAGEGLKDKICRFYLGYAAMAWADFSLVGTQKISGVAPDRGSYQIDCMDIQRAARKDVFTLAQTTLAQSVAIGDTTINVSSTVGFSTVFHGPSYSDAPSSTVGYIRIKDEKIRYTGTTSTSFTGCTRGALGTIAAAYQVDGSTPTARREKVTEEVYLELPAVKLAYAILTGTLHAAQAAAVIHRAVTRDIPLRPADHSQRFTLKTEVAVVHRAASWPAPPPRLPSQRLAPAAEVGDSASLPTKWHLGIPTSLVRLADFTGIGPDLWNTSSDSDGVIVRFEGLNKTDGKAFLELEICRLLGVFMPVYMDGALGIRRMTRVLDDAPALVKLDESNIVSMGALKHDLGSMHNVFAVDWNFNGKEFTRRTTYIDATSAAIHGEATTLELKFKGLHGGRHTDGAIFKLIDSLRDRYSAPPQRLSVVVPFHLNGLEVGDLAGVTAQSVRDFAGQGNSIDRTFEIQSTSVNFRSGEVALELFGSTSEAVAQSPTAATTALPDAFYTAEGTNLTSVLTIVGGVVSAGSYNLPGNASLTAAGAIYYYDGDLTIPTTVTLNITLNVQLRIKGALTINGLIDGIGDGLAGVADDSTPTSRLTGNAGYVGNARGQDGIHVAVDFAAFPWFGPSAPASLATLPPAMTVGRNPSFPFLSLQVVGNTLKGLPTDIRGTGGGPGGKVTEGLNFVVTPIAQRQAGGTGAAGGAGLCIISRGLSLGIASLINLSGANSSNPVAYSANGHNFYAGAGAPGGPGALLILLDGDILSVPDLANRFRAWCGQTPVPAAINGKLTHLDAGAARPHEGNELTWAGFEDPSATSGLDLSFSASRIQYIPAPETATTDSSAIPAPENLTVNRQQDQYTVSFASRAVTPLGGSLVHELWEHTASTPFSSATKIAEGVQTTFVVPKTNTTTYYVWVRTRVTNAAGQVSYSATNPVTTGATAGAASSGSAVYATATPASWYVQGTAANLTTGTITASLVGGTGTTFSWARISGSTKFAANSASSATSSFTATGLNNWEEASAVFRCTINSTYTVDVEVTAYRIGSGEPP